MSMKDRFWPSLNDSSSAKSAAYQGVFACAGIVAISIVLSLLGTVK
jgi:hypothetical protein